MANGIGVIAGLKPGGESLRKVAELGLGCCQLASWKPDIWTDEAASRVRAESEELGVRIAAFWSGYSGRKVWNLVEGPSTLGIVPEDMRAARVEELKRGGDFAKTLGAPATITHLGFIPEEPGDPRFEGVVKAVREIAAYLKQLGLEFWFETGQETPVTMLRLIEQVGTGNLGVNLDPANLILYGKGNPVDALDVFGRYVRNVHVKDGLYPTDPMKLGREVEVGEGRVRFPELVRRLSEVGFAGDYIIEREIGGEGQKEKIAATVEYLQGLLAGS